VPHREPIGAAHVRALVDAAADAGFGGVSIWTAHHDWAVADGMSSEAFFALHAERGLTIPAAEIVFEWAPADGSAAAAENAHLLDVAARTGAASVIAVTMQPELPSLREAGAELASLCDRAGERGLAVSVEFLPWSGVPDIATAARLFDAVDRDNLGLVLDAWHWFRQPGGPDEATLRGIPPERIHILQLNDAPADAWDDVMLETSTGRRLPGEGAVDLLGLLGVLADMGATPTVVSEVFAASLTALGPAENARRQHAAAVALLARQTAPEASGTF
jgi:sugar phosphate isomerase/epimerase